MKPSIGSETKPIEHLYVKNLHTDKDFIHVGTILAYSANGTIPSGYLLCDGSAVSRAIYPDLFNLLGETYGAGDGSTTFNLPDFNQAERFAQGSTVAGTVKAAGLPNITGTFDGNTDDTSSQKKGAFYDTNIHFRGPNGNDDGGVVGFDASKSNPIYGASDTVQPHALTMRYIIKAFSGQTADSALIDITKYADALNRKVDKADFLDSAETHNAIYRGKDLTEYFSSGQMSTDLANGNFSNIFVGDYIIKTVTVDGVTYDNVKWIVMHINYHLHEGDTETTQNHVVLMPEERLGTRQMNGSATTSGGYIGSAMWTAHIPKVVTGIENAFGAEHVLEHRERLTNAMDGASNSRIWVSVKANLADEAMVYGAPIMSSSVYDTGECNTQLAAFKLNHGLICSKRYWWWLRSVAYSATFCTVSDRGHVGSGLASDSGGGVRPYFLLY